MPSMAGSGPGWSPHGPCRASRWCSRGQARASAFPYRAVAVTVAAAGDGQVASSPSRNSAPCRAGRPQAADWAGVGGEYMTLLARSRPRTCTGRSRSSHASRVRSYPESKTARTSGSPSFQRPAAASRATTSRSCAAVTSVGSSSGPSRTASSGSVHDVRPGSSAATKEYGQPGIICLFPLPRAEQWQNSRPGLVSASGRSQFETSQASRIRPSSHRRSGIEATACRSRPIRTSPQFSAS